MDPEQTTWMMKDAFDSKEYLEAQQLAEELLEWQRRGGSALLGREEPFDEAIFIIEACDEALKAEGTEA